MSKRSTVTVRERPVSDVSTAAGTFKVHGETIAQETNARIEIVDLTDRVTALVRSLHMKEGLVSIFSMHTTCTVFINEFQQALLADMKTFLEKIVSADAGWLHNDPAHSDCDRSNADLDKVQSFHRFERWSERITYSVFDRRSIDASDRRRRIGDFLGATRRRYHHPGKGQRSMRQ